MSISRYTLWKVVKAHWLMRLGIAGSILCAAGAPAAGQGGQVEHLQFECSVALLTPQQQFTAPTPVTIYIIRDGGNLSGIRVVDEGGILYPGGDMRVTRRADAVALEAVAMPPERPGTWTGRVERTMYRLTLASGQLAEAIVIGLGSSPAAQTGRHGLVWNATNQVEGLSRPLSGSGAGNCARVNANGGAE